MKEKYTKPVITVDDLANTDVLLDSGGYSPTPTPTINPTKRVYEQENLYFDAWGILSGEDWIS